MRLWFLLEREFAVWTAARKGRAKLVWVGAAGVGVACLFLLLDKALRFSSLGLTLFLFLTGGMIWLMAWAGMGLSGELVEDRQNGMLGLVFLTGTKSRDLFLSKLGGRLAAAAYPALALAPCLLLAFLWGRVSGQMVLVAVGLVPVGVIFLAGFDFLAAAVKDEPGAAEQFSKNAKFAALLWPWLVDHASRRIAGTMPMEWVYYFSPASSAYDLVFALMGPKSFDRALVSMASGLAIGLLALSAGAWILDRSWRRNGAPRRQTGERWRLEWRAKIQPVLEKAPLEWYGALDRRALWYAWFSVGAVVGIWCVCVALWRESFFFPVTFYVAAGLVVWLVRGQMLLRTAQRMAARRTSGELELLLTTPQQPDALLEGEKAAVYRQFSGLIWVTRGLVVFFLLGATMSLRWDAAVLGAHGCVAAVLLMMARLRPDDAFLWYQWVALNTGHASGAVVQRQMGSLAGFIVPMYQLLTVGSANYRTFPSGSALEVFVGAALLMGYFLTAVWFWHKGHETRMYLHGHFRAVAQAPLRSAKELKNWDGKPLT